MATTSFQWWHDKEPLWAAEAIELLRHTKDFVICDKHDRKTADHVTPKEDKFDDEGGCLNCVTGRIDKEARMSLLRRILPADGSRAVCPGWTHSSQEHIASSAQIDRLGRCGECSAYAARYYHAKFAEARAVADAAHEKCEQCGQDVFGFLEHAHRDRRDKVKCVTTLTRKPSVERELQKVRSLCDACHAAETRRERAQDREERIAAGVKPSRPVNLGKKLRRQQQKFDVLFDTYDGHCAIRDCPYGVARNMLPEEINARIKWHKNVLNDSKPLSTLENGGTEPAFQEALRNCRPICSAHDKLIKSLRNTRDGKGYCIDTDAPPAHWAKVTQARVAAPSQQAEPDDEPAAKRYHPEPKSDH